MLRQDPGAHPGCTLMQAAQHLRGGDVEVWGMLINGPEAAEYGDEQVWRGATALGLEVSRDDVADHRHHRCDCRKASA